MTRSGIDFERLAHPGVRRLRAYDPGHDLVALRKRFGAGGLIELGSNENPYGPSPLAREALQNALADVHRYPDPLGGDLKRALATLHGIGEAQILLGNGSHELLMQFARVFAGPDSGVVASQYGFAVYALAAQAVGADFVAAPAFAQNRPMARGHDLDAIAAAVKPSTRLIYLANPNNPTGTWFGADALASLLARVPEETLMVIDEAYAEMADAPDYASALPLLARHPNAIVTRTFSKAYGLAGLRIGYAVGHPDLIAIMERVRESFNVNALGLAAAAAALGDVEHLHATCAANARQRQALAAALSERGIACSPSQTNFLLVELGPESIALERELIARGAVLRPMVGYGLPECLRITVGDADENARLLRMLDEVRA